VLRTDAALPPATEKGKRRRERIIEAATRLFHESGYHATGIDEIGRAAGITGPGVYRHFASKDEILMVVLDRIWMRLRQGLDAAGDLDDAEALEILIATHVDTTVDKGAEIALMHRELRNLPDNYQAKANRNRRTYESEWVKRIVGLHPHLDTADARMVARSVFWLISAHAADPPRPPMQQDRARGMLRAMAYGAIEGA
jgi:AcrR family transcriptional regulator